MDEKSDPRNAVPALAADVERLRQRTAALTGELVERARPAIVRARSVRSFLHRWPHLPYVVLGAIAALGAATVGALFFAGMRYERARVRSRWLRR